MLSSQFSMTTEKLVEAFYEPKNCDNHKGVTMLCSRFVANSRFFDISNSTSFIENSNINQKYENSYDNKIDTHLSKHTLGSETVENTPGSSRQTYKNKLHTPNMCLEDMGFVVNGESKTFTLQLEPSIISYFKYNITSYSPNRKLSSLVKKNSVNNSNKDKYNAERKLCTSTSKSSSRSSPNHNFYKTIDQYRNYCRLLEKKFGKSIYNKKEDNFDNHNMKKIISKYWLKRHMLFSKFDLGILLDDESFYSVCPEVLSYHIAKRCQNKVVLDPFCGAGGNIIQLANTCDLVIAIDIDPKKILFAKHNAEIYGVAEKIEFIVGDFFTLAPLLKADVIFMSPPWGGPNYSINENFSIDLMCTHHLGGGYRIFDLVKNIAPNIAFHMPKTTNIYEFLWLARDYGKVEIQQNIINHRLNSITAFYGEFTDITDNDY